MTIPTVTPSQLRAGDSVRFTRDFGSEYPSATWAATLSISNGKKHYTITGTDNGDGQLHYFYLAGNGSAAWEPGHYRFVITVTDGADRYTIENGDIEIKGNLALGAYDDRSQTKKILDQLNERIDGSSLRDDQSYSIAGRSISRMSINELIDAQKVYSARYKSEVRKQRRKEGKKENHLVRVSMR